jgi:hypothetical protein
VLSSPTCHVLLQLEVQAGTVSGGWTTQPQEGCSCCVPLLPSFKRPVAVRHRRTWTSFLCSHQACGNMSCHASIVTFPHVRCRPHFPLYTEAMKLFNHTEGMVRAAVRMLTINVYKVGDPAMLDFVSSAPCSHYFHEVALHLSDRALQFDRHLVALQCGACPSPSRPHVP